MSPLWATSAHTLTLMDMKQAPPQAPPFPRASFLMVNEDNPQIGELWLVPAHTAACSERQEVTPELVEAILCAQAALPGAKVVALRRQNGGGADQMAGRGGGQ